MRPLFLLTTWIGVSSEAHNLTWSGKERTPDNRPCNVDELLPRAPSRSSTIASEWSDGNLVKPRYGCDCSFYRARCGASFCFMYSFLCWCICSNATSCERTVPLKVAAALCRLLLCVALSLCSLCGGLLWSNRLYNILWSRNLRTHTVNYRISASFGRSQKRCNSIAVLFDLPFSGGNLETIQAYAFPRAGLWHHGIMAS